MQSAVAAPATAFDCSQASPAGVATAAPPGATAAETVEAVAASAAALQFGQQQP
jgi:hypothetical protein